MSKGSERPHAEMRKTELLELAKRLGLTHLSRLRKAEIIELIETATRRRERRRTVAPAKKQTSAAPKRTRSAGPVKKAATKEAATKKAAAKKAATKKAATKKAATKKAATKKAAAPASLRRTRPSRQRSNRPVERTPELKEADALPADVEAVTPAAPDELRSPPLSHEGSKAVDPVPSPGSSDVELGGDVQALLGVDDELPELEAELGENALILLPRDPKWLYAYWVLDEEYKAAARDAGGRIFALRLYDVTGLGHFDGTNAHGCTEYRCNDWAQGWYLAVPRARRSYQAEIGYLGVDDDPWFPLARSATVEAPTDRPSDRQDAQFVAVDLSSPLPDPGGSVGGFEPPDPRRPPPASTVASSADRPSVSVATWSVATAAGSVTPGSVTLWSAAMTAGSVTPGSVTPGSVTPGSVTAGSMTIRPGEGFPRSAGAAPGPHLIPHRELRFEPGAQKEGAVAEQIPRQPLLIQAHAELVISGQAEAGTLLRVAGRDLPVGPDGAFALRLAIDEGMADLEIAAESDAGDREQMHLWFGRLSERK